MSPAPKLDQTISFLREGYSFGTTRFDRLGTDAFETRLLGRPATMVRGAAAAEMFFDGERFVRKRAMPRRALRSFIGTRGVQTLDDDEHRVRKAMFMSLVDDGSIDSLLDAVTRHFDEAVERWADQDDVILLHEIALVLCRAACEWVGVPVPAEEVERRTRHFEAMIDSPAALGRRYWRGWLARRSCERWIGTLIDAARSGDVPPAGALGAIALHRDHRGSLLRRRVAAVEVINMLRPIVAIARYVTLAAHALRTSPRQELDLADDAHLAAFVQEVRRFYPFFPAVAARVRSGFSWHGHDFVRGRRVLLDLYATNHDPAGWDRPDEFLPDRWIDRRPDPYVFVPQGGGDPHEGHRCAGESVTVAVTELVLTRLVDTIEYDVPPQDLDIPLHRLPAQPNSGFRLTRVRRLAAAHAEKNLAERRQ